MLEKALHELITDALGHTRVYALRAPQDATQPYVVFQRIDGSRFHHLQGPSGLAQATIQIDCYATRYYDAKQEGADIETAIDGYRGTVSYGTDSPQATLRIGGVSIQNEVDILDETDDPILNRHTSQYLVTYEQ